MLMTRDQRLARLKTLESVDFSKVPTIDLERAWLDATCLYEVLDDAGMSDDCWDRLTKHLWTHRNRLSSPFKHAVPIACLKSSTGSGIDWQRGIPQLVLEALQ
jgi:hypothetical protein